MAWQERAQDYLDRKKKGWWKLSEGLNVIRVLPTKNNKKDKEPSIHMVYRTHEKVGPDKRFVVCGKTEDGSGECWLCDTQIPKLEKSDSKAKRKQAEVMKAKELMALQVAYIDKEGKGKWRGPELYRLNAGGRKSLAFRLIKTISNPKYNVTSVKKGRNVEIEREGTGFEETEYSPPLLQSERTEVPEKIVKAMKTFNDLLPKYDERRVKAAYFGKDLDEESSSSDKSSEGDDSEMPDKKKKASEEDSEEESSSVSSSASSEDDSEEEDSSNKSSSETDDSEEESSDEGSSEKDSSEEESEKGSSEEDSEESSSSKKSSEKGSDEESEAEDSEEEEKPKRGKGKKPGPKPKGKKKK